MEFCMKCGKSGTGNYCPDCGGRIRGMVTIARKKGNTRRHNFISVSRLSRLGMGVSGCHIAEACWCAARLIVDRERGWDDAYTAGGVACKTLEELKKYLDEVEQTAQRIMDDVVKHVDERKEESYEAARN